MTKLALGIGLLAVAFAGGALAAKEAAKKEIVQETPAELNFKEVMPGMPVQAAEIWKGPGGAGCQFIKFPKGTAVPLHWHSKDAHAVIISGSWGSGAEGGAEKLVGPGAHQFIPAKLKHTTKCGDAADCVVYSCTTGPFDIKGLPPPPK
jgi:quercetin dioxygenase-like cupin family protein